jgi:uncharacterized protein YecE (DUF72 family)
MKALRVGTSGWFYKDWKGRFYPQDMPSEAYLDYYSRYFDTVELNGVFYRLPTPEMVKGWYRRSPKGFIFAYKGSRFITHMKKLTDPQGALRLMFRRADLLKEKLGPVLFQLPPFFSVNTARLKTFIKALPGGYDYVFEFRHESWFREDIYDALREKKMSLCLYDMRSKPSPRVLTGPLVYVRMHGSEGKYAGNYTRPALQEWAGGLRTWRRGRSGFVYFNNDVQGHAVRNAQTLKELL